MMSKTIEQLAKEHGAIVLPTWTEMFLDAGEIVFSNFDELEAFAKAYAQTQGQSNWISVDVRLPDVGVQVLVFPSDALPIRYMKKDGDDVVWFFSALPVTHWMPLPAAPIESGVKG
ncbi:MAG: hypothetical protein CTY33_00140 [Methylotenera sp.]|nr:MAG: hypothetical protein CTY33_00140 [Methylotenera sp.]